MSKFNNVQTLKEVVAENLAHVEKNIAALQVMIDGANMAGNTNRLKLPTMQEDLARFKDQREQLRYESDILA